jgi:uncharacterized protein (DUF58 family)
LPESVSAGDLLVVELVASSSSRRLGSWAVVAEDTVRLEGAATANGEAISASALFSYVPPGQTRTTVYHGRLTRRGRYKFGPLRISTRFPLGLLKYRITLDQPDTLTVYPRLGRLTQRWIRLQQSVDIGAGHVARRQGFMEGEFYGLRDWRSGDSRRWIHWRTSARRQALVVRQFEQQRSQDLALVLDLWQPITPHARQVDTVELAVSFAASVVEELCRRGGQWLCVSIATRAVWIEHGDSSMPLLHEMMRGLAVAEASADDRLPEALAAALERLPTGGRIIVVGTRPADLSDVHRFGKLLNDPSQRAALARIRFIDASSDEFAEYLVPV